jgi:hypothetical protein
MNEFDEQNSGDSGISRRTVTKAMAWAVPVIAIAAPAPAFAASGGILQFAGVGCKLPGNSNSIYKGYAFLLSVENNTNDPITLNIVSITLDGNNLGTVRSVNLDTGTIQQNPFLLPADTSAPNVALLTEFAPNSQNGILTVVYTVNGGAQQTITVSVPSAPPLNGASCSAFTPAQKITINGAIGGVPAWAPNTAYAVGDTVSLGGGFVTATVAGTSGASAPALPAPGGTVVDGTVTWQRALAA